MRHLRAVCVMPTSGNSGACCAGKQRAESATNAPGPKPRGNGEVCDHEMDTWAPTHDLSREIRQLRYRFQLTKGENMSGKNKDQLYVEKRPDGDFALSRGGADRASGLYPTQKDAIDAGRKMHPDMPVHVERVKHTPVGKPDQWRKP